MIDQVTSDDIEAIKNSGIIEVCKMMGMIASAKGVSLMTQHNKKVLSRLYRVSEWGQIPQPIRALFDDAWDEGWGKGI